MQKQGYIVLDSVIQDYLNESEQSQSKYFKVFHIAFRGFEQLGLNFFYSVRTVKLPVLANLTVALPPDYQKWLKVGTLNSESEIIPLYYNDKLTTYADVSADRLSKTQDDTLLDEFGPNTWCNYWNGAYYTNIYGVPSGAPFVGGFRIDTDNNLIVLDPGFSYDYLMLEYVATPTVGEDYYLPMEFREALIAWIYWRDGKAKSVRTHMALGTNRDNKHDFFTERRNAIAAYKPIRMSEKYQASQEMTRLCVKS